MRKKVYKKYKKDNKIKKWFKKLNFNLLEYSIIFSLFISLGVIFAHYYFNIYSLINKSNIALLSYIEYSLPASSSEPLNVSIPTQWQNLLYGSTTGISLASTPNTSQANKNSGSNQIIWHGSRDKKEIALTFDADMTPVMVDWLRSGQVASYDDTRITTYLIKHDIKATFFLTGLWIQSYPEMTRELSEMPIFELENHSYSHPSMAGYCFDQPQIPQSQYPFEIEKTQQLLKQIAHVTPKYFRFPGGCYNQADLNLIKREGLQTIHWDVVANDGFNDNEEQIINNVLDETHNGSIIVMHIGGKPNTPATAQALPIIINTLQKRGYKFVTVSELLNNNLASNKLDPKKYLSSLETFQYIP